MAEHALLDCLDALLGEDPARLSEAVLEQRANVLLAAGDRVAGLLAATIGEVEARGLAGAPMNPWGRTEAWLAGLDGARHGRGELARHVARARGCEAVPLVAGLHAAGEVSTGFADAARTGARRLPAEARPGWDALLAGDASTVCPTEVPALLAHLQTMIDPDSVNDAAALAEETSELWVSAYGSHGAWAISGTLHGLEGELLATMLNHYAAPQGTEDTRSPAQRRAAALGQILRIAQRTTDDPEHRPPPHGQDAHLIVLVTDHSWHAQPGSPAATTTTGSTLDPGRLAALRCTTPVPDILIHGTPGGEPPMGATGTPPSVAAQQADLEAAQLRRILTGVVGSPAAGRLEPLAYGRAQRTASRAQWLALIARDRHCVQPGCTRDPSWCEAHHTREWDADHGRTDLDQLAVLCREHHTALHRTGRHFHPPWCHCSTCTAAPTCRAGPGNTWTTHKHPPRYRTHTAPPRVSPASRRCPLADHVSPSRP